MKSNIFLRNIMARSSCISTRWWWHIILIPSQPVFLFTPYCCMLITEATNTYFIIWSLTWRCSNPLSNTLI